MRIVMEDGTEQRAYVTASGSYMSSSDSRVHFGLGSAKSVKLLEIAWPSGAVQKLQQVKGDQILTVEEPAEGAGPQPAPLIQKLSFIAN